MKHSTMKMKYTMIQPAYRLYMQQTAILLFVYCKEKSDGVVINYKLESD